MPGTSRAGCGVVALATVLAKDPTGNARQTLSLLERRPPVARDSGARRRVASVGVALSGGQARPRRNRTDAGDLLPSPAGVRLAGSVDPATQRPRTTGSATAGPLASGARTWHLQLRREPDPGHVGAELAAGLGQRAVEQYAPTLGGHRQRVVLSPAAAGDARGGQRCGAARRRARVSACSRLRRRKRC